MVDVPDGADVDVRLGPLELGLGHWVPLSVVFAVVRVLWGVRDVLGWCRGRYSPVALAMISLATFGGTSAYESNTMV